MRTSYAWAKKIHRWSIFAFIPLMLVMIVTGLLLDGDALVLNFVSLSDVVLAHRFTSKIFVVGLVVMSTTGVWMYLAPEIMKRMVKKTPSVAPPLSSPNPV